ncbi:phosphonate C-P lyase system protein PhnH [Primorskyibacter sp. 2E107]|uniref:phosphonate C-P lyase system protein PhnH n=1 Tax=Primorskyibacter sp. 2E107 TaxID=3403458 RepID=UPI003AF43BFC
MPAIPVPSASETRCNATFEALMWALSRPGLSRDLPQPRHRALVEALIDRECAVNCDDPDLARSAAGLGAALVAREAADHVFADRLDSAAVLRTLRQGSDLHPEDGATLVLEATLGRGQRLRMTGPGVDGAVEIAVGGLPDGFWQERTRVMRYPMGFDLFLTSGARVLGVPRSTAVEVV